GRTPSRRRPPRRRGARSRPAVGGALRARRGRPRATRASCRRSRPRAAACPRGPARAGRRCRGRRRATASRGRFRPRGRRTRGRPERPTDVPRASASRCRGAAQRAARPRGSRGGTLRRPTRAPRPRPSRPLRRRTRGDRRPTRGAVRARALRRGAATGAQPRRRGGRPRRVVSRAAAAGAAEALARLHEVEKRYLFTPGPTPVPPEVLAASAEPIVHHRGADFRESYARVLARLKDVFRTQADVLLFTASGTGAMESAVANLCAPGDRVAVVSHGSFGERWIAICEQHGLDVVPIRYEWGEAPVPDEVRDAVRDASPEIVFCQQSDTSTGVVSDVRAIKVAVGETPLVVDAISSLGAVPLETDEWGIDVVVSG